jgi:hypothetical protein
MRTILRRESPPGGSPCLQLGRVVILNSTNGPPCPYSLAPPNLAIESAQHTGWVPRNMTSGSYQPA